jgi:hypothetical protein
MTIISCSPIKILTRMFNIQLDTMNSKEEKIAVENRIRALTTIFKKI